MSDIKLTLVKGYHATAMEKTTIRKMIEQGVTKCATSSRKFFEINILTDTQVEVRVGSKYVRTIGDIARWSIEYMTFAIERSVKKSKSLLKVELDKLKMENQ